MFLAKQVLKGAALFLCVRAPEMKIRPLEPTSWAVRANVFAGTQIRIPPIWVA